MLGLMVLFGLGVWLVVTLMSMFAGYKLFKGVSKNTVLGVLGAFLGFMLTMGGLIIYWAVEYYQIQQQVTQLCESEGGITVYVTPEQWRKQIGEAEWESLKPYSNEAIYKTTPDLKSVDYNGQTYKYTEGSFRSGNIENRRLALYDSYEHRDSNIQKLSYIFLDKQTGQALIHVNQINHFNEIVAESLLGLKFWLDNINDCSSSYSKEFHDLAIQYSNLKEGKNYE